MPQHVRPVKYKLELTPFLVTGNFTIQGFVSITFDSFVEGATNVTLHTKDITIDSASLALSDLKTQEKLEIDSIEAIDDLEFTVFHLKNGLKKDTRYVLKMSFVSLLGDNLNGFYRSSYVDGNGEERYILNKAMSCARIKRYVFLSQDDGSDSV